MVQDAEAREYRYRLRSKTTHDAIDRCPRKSGATRVLPNDTNRIACKSPCNWFVTNFSTYGDALRVSK